MSGTIPPDVTATWSTLFEPRCAVGVSGLLARMPVLLLLRLLAGALPILSGCSINHYQPSHFQFTTIVRKTRPGPDGWRAACIHAVVINKATLEPYVCEFGVGMPIETLDVGLMSEVFAQRAAATCANEALSAVIAAPASPFPGLVCTQFRNTYHEFLNRVVLGSRVTTQCEKATRPVRIEF